MGLYKRKYETHRSLRIARPQWKGRTICSRRRKSCQGSWWRSRQGEDQDSLRSLKGKKFSDLVAEGTKALGSMGSGSAGPAAAGGEAAAGAAPKEEEKEEEEDDEVEMDGLFGDDGY